MFLTHSIREALSGPYLGSLCGCSPCPNADVDIITANENVEIIKGKDLIFNKIYVL